MLGGRHVLAAHVRHLAGKEAETSFTPFTESPVMTAAGETPVTTAGAAVNILACIPAGPVPHLSPAETDKSTPATAAARDSVGHATAHNSQSTAAHVDPGKQRAPAETDPAQLSTALAQTAARQPSQHARACTHTHFSNVLEHTPRRNGDAYRDGDQEDLLLAATPAGGGSLQVALRQLQGTGGHFAAGFSSGGANGLNVHDSSVGREDNDGSGAAAGRPFSPVDLGRALNAAAAAAVARSDSLAQLSASCTAGDMLHLRPGALESAPAANDQLGGPSDITTILASDKNATPAMQSPADFSQRMVSPANPGTPLPLRVPTQLVPPGRSSPTDAVATYATDSDSDVDGLTLLELRVALRKAKAAQRAATAGANGLGRNSGVGRDANMVSGGLGDASGSQKKPHRRKETHFSPSTKSSPAQPPPLGVAEAVNDQVRPIDPGGPIDLIAPIESIEATMAAVQSATLRSLLVAPRNAALKAEIRWNRRQPTKAPAGRGRCGKRPLSQVVS